MRVRTTPLSWGRPAPKWAPSGRAQSPVKSSQWVQVRNYSSLFTTQKTVPAEVPDTDTLRSKHTDMRNAFANWKNLTSGHKGGWRLEWGDWELWVYSSWRRHIIPLLWRKKRQLLFFRCQLVVTEKKTKLFWEVHSERVMDCRKQVAARTISKRYKNKWISKNI